MRLQDCPTGISVWMPYCTTLLLSLDCPGVPETVLLLPTGKQCKKWQTFLDEVVDIFTCCLWFWQHFSFPVLKGFSYLFIGLHCCIESLLFSSASLFLFPPYPMAARWNAGGKGRFSKSCCLYLYGRAVPVPVVSKDNCLLLVFAVTLMSLLSFDQQKQHSSPSFQETMLMSWL